MSAAQDIVHYIAASLARHPERVHVDVIPSSEETIVELRVSEEDISRVIGKGGSVVRSLRSLLRLCGSKERAHYVLEIVE